MKTLLAAMCLVAICAIQGCANDGPSPISTSQPSPPRPSTSAVTRQNPELIGQWKGTGRIAVNWCKQTKLDVSLSIAPDGSVTGKIGDASLRDAAIEFNRTPLERALGLKTDFIIRGKLQGPILAAEDVTRQSVSIPFDLASGQIRGGLATNGNQFGGKESMIFTAGATLSKAPD